MKRYTVNVKSRLVVRGQITVTAPNAKEAARLACEAADACEDSLSNLETESGRFAAFEVYRAETETEAQS